jgi:hypothetical protein
MTRDDITRMAKDAGFCGFDGENKCLREFANLVAAAEREACAALCFQMWNKWLDSEDSSEFTRPDAEDCAAAIRARGQV